MRTLEGEIGDAFAGGTGGFIGTGGGLVVLGVEGWTSSWEGLESIFIWGVRGREGRYRDRYVQNGWGRGKEGRLWFGCFWECKIYNQQGSPLLGLIIIVSAFGGLVLL